MKIRPTTLYWFSKDLEYPTEAIERAARHARLWVFPHHDALGSGLGPDYTSIRVTISQVRAVNPDQWIGLYVGGLAYKQEIDPPAYWLSDDDLLHYPAGHTLAGQPLVYHDTARIWQQGPMHYALPDLNSRETLRQLAEGYTALALDLGVQGFLLDGYDPHFYAQLARGTPSNTADQGMFGASAGCAEGPMHTPAAWVGPLSEFGRVLRWHLGQIGAEFWFNGIHPWPASGNAAVDAWNGPNLTGRLKHADGAMMEAVGMAYQSIADFEGIIATVRQAVDEVNGAVFLQASSWGYPDPLASARLTDPVGVSRFFLGLYLLVADPRVGFGHTPWVPYRAWDGEDAPAGAPSGNPAVYWSPDWDLDYGYPLAPAVPLVSCYGVPTAVWGRQYSRCVVLVNPADTHQQAILSGTFREWHPETGPVIDQAAQAPYYLLNVAPKTARVLFKVAA